MRKDKKGLSELWNRQDFTRLDRDTAEIMAIMTDSTEILEKLDNYENEEGECSMCLAMPLRNREVSDIFERKRPHNIRYPDFLSICLTIFFLQNII